MEKLFKDRKNKNAEELVRRSSKAVCGIMEREITVPSSKVASSIRALKAKGFQIIGTSHGNTPTKKIWFIRAGGF